mgnify:CR=1 FL=1
MGKIKKLEDIVSKLRKEKAFEATEIFIIKNPARICLTFQYTKEDLYNFHIPEEVLEIIDKYSLQKDKSEPQYEGDKVTFRFKSKNLKY